MDASKKGKGENVQLKKQVRMNAYGLVKISVTDRPMDQRTDPPSDNGVLTYFYFFFFLTLLLKLRWVGKNGRPKRNTQGVTPVTGDVKNAFRKKIWWENFDWSLYFWFDEVVTVFKGWYFYHLHMKHCISTKNWSIFRKYELFGKIFSSAWIWDQPRVSSSKRVEMVVERR